MWHLECGRPGQPDRTVLQQPETSNNRTGRKHGEPWFSGTLVIGDPQENVEKSDDFLNFSNVFLGCSGREFWKIIRAGLPHFFGPV